MRSNKLIAFFILLAFFLSGISALLYQVAWQRLLTVYYGVGFYSVTLIVSIYMFGLGIGGYFGGILAERSKNKVMIYLLIEVLIGMFGIISPFFLDGLGKVTSGMNYILTTIMLFAFLSIPTFLMGTTLPMLVKIYNLLKKNFFNSVSTLYFINTLGAACGALLATYVIVSFFGLDTCIHVAVCINVFIGLLVYLYVNRFYKSNIVTNANETVATNVTERTDVLKRIYYIVFITGFIAIGYELIWFRVISVLTKDSAYSFSTVLFVFLLGLALGSYFINKLTRNFSFEKKKRTYFMLQFILGLYAIASFYLFYKLNTFPNKFAHFADTSFERMVHPDFGASNGIKQMLVNYDIFVWPFLFLFVPTLLMGASFPLVTYLGMKDENSEGKTVGTIYFFNVSGNVLGGIITGFVLLPIIKTTGTVILFSLVNVLFLLGTIRKGNRKDILISGTLLGVIILFLAFVFPSNYNFYKSIHTSYPNRTNPAAYTTLIEEGRESIVVTYYNDTELFRNYINGSSHGFRPGYTYFYEAYEIYKYHPKPENVFVLGFGAGSITEACLRNPVTKKVTMVEINSTMLNNLYKINDVKKIMDDPKLEYHIEDGRRFLESDPEKYDLIFIDPLRMQTAYSNNIHSLEFFELLKRHLKPDGILMVGGQLHPVKEKTLMEVFKHIRAYTYFMMGSDAEFVMKEESSNTMLNAFTNIEKEKVLEENPFAGSDDSLRTAFINYPVNRDWRPVTEYYMGLDYKINKSIKNNR